MLSRILIQLYFSTYYSVILIYSDEEVSLNSAASVFWSTSFNTSSDTDPHTGTPSHWSKNGATRPV